MGSAGIISSIGLGLDIAGVVLVFIFGLSPHITETGAGFLVWGSDEAEKKKYRRYKRMGRIGLGLLIAGFSLQLTSNFFV